MWESIRDWALNELREVKRAPTAIVVLLVIGVMGGWWAGSEFYAERIEVYQLQIAALERGIAAVAPTPEPSVVTPNMILVGVLALSLTIGSAAVASALGNKGTVARLSEEYAAQRRDLEKALQDCNLSQTSLRETKRWIAHDCLRRHSRILINSLKPIVTIRFVEYGGDYDLAKQIEKAFADWTGWAVTLDGNNTPALPRADRYKVLFESAGTRVFDEFAHAFSESELLGVSVGGVMADREDQHHLVVRILPSAS